MCNRNFNLMDEEKKIKLIVSLFCNYCLFKAEMEIRELLNHIIMVVFLNSIFHL